MHSEVTQISPVLVEVKVEIPWDRVRKDLDESFRSMARSARVRGFRPGKVPSKVLRQLFGKQVKGEVKTNLVEQGLMYAVTEHELQVVAAPVVEAPVLTDGEPLIISAKIEVRPKIERVDTSKLKVERPSASVANEAVDAELERLRFEHAEVRVPEPMRGAKEGDRLVIDYRVSVDGEARPDMGAEARTVDLGRDQLIDEIDQGLVGMVPGDAKEITVELSERHGRGELAGKTALFDVQVKELKERLLPEVDDELAKDVGDFATLLELRLDIRRGLEALAERRAHTALRSALIDALVETNDVPVPPSMVEQEAHRMSYELSAFMHMTGQASEPSEEMQSSMHERATHNVKAAILLGALASEQGIEVSEAEVGTKLAEVAESTGKHLAKVRAEHQGERLGRLENQLLEEKLTAYLMTVAQLHDAEEDGSEAGADGGAVTGAAGGGEAST